MNRHFSICFKAGPATKCITLAAVLGLGVLLGGCTTTPSFEPVGGGVTAPDGVYKLREGDVVLVEVFQEPYMTTRQRILGDGTISVGLIGRVRIAGESVSAAASQIAAKLNEKQLVNPQVNISVESYAPRRFVVWGQVRNPGSFVIPGEEQLTLPEAIAMAGGNTDIGDARSVTITRRGETGQQRMKINALSPAAESFYIREGDVIRVAETIF